MSEGDIDTKDLRERIAEECHKQWSGWMQYLFDRCSLSNSFGGNVVIPSPLVFRWNRQIKTAYSDLSEEEKNSDRIEADKIIAIIKEHSEKSSVNPKDTEEYLRMMDEAHKQTAKSNIKFD